MATSFKFQSRNRESSYFNNDRISGDGQRVSTSFQSRNRESSYFNQGVSVGSVIGTAFQSRNRESSYFNWQETVFDSYLQQVSIS